MVLFRFRFEVYLNLAIDGICEIQYTYLCPLLQAKVKSNIVKPSKHSINDTDRPTTHTLTHRNLYLT